MKPHRVTIKYKVEAVTATISTTVPAANESEAIKKVIKAKEITNVVSKKAELLKIV